MSDTTDCCTTAFHRGEDGVPAPVFARLRVGFSIHRLLDTDGEMVEKQVSEAVAFLDSRGNPVANLGIAK